MRTQDSVNAVMRKKRWRILIELSDLLVCSDNDVRSDSFVLRWAVDRRSPVRIERGACGRPRQESDLLRCLSFRARHRKGSLSYSLY